MPGASRPGDAGGWPAARATLAGRLATLLGIHGMSDRYLRARRGGV